MFPHTTNLVLKRTGKAVEVIFEFCMLKNDKSQIEAADMEINKSCLHHLDYDPLDPERGHLFDHFNYSDHSQCCSLATD